MWLSLHIMISFSRHNTKGTHIQISRKFSKGLGSFEYQVHAEFHIISPVTCKSELWHLITTFVISFQVPVGNVSFAPGGKSGTGGQGYTSSYMGSMESLNSTNSSTFSLGSTISTGELIMKSASKEKHQKNSNQKNCNLFPKRKLFLFWRETLLLPIFHNVPFPSSPADTEIKAPVESSGNLSFSLSSC